MQTRDLEAQDSGAAAVGRTFGSEIAWLILRHFVAEFPGLSSVKHPFEKCQEVSEVSNQFSNKKKPLYSHYIVTEGRESKTRGGRPQDSLRGLRVSIARRK